MLKRSENETHLEGYWDLPGGKIGDRHTPREGLLEEVKEESNIAIEIIEPVDTWNYIKDDKTNIVGITFLCKPLDTDVALSDEHSDFRWIVKDDLNDIKAHSGIKENIRKALDVYRNR